jgi:NADH dehydrogenase
MWLLSDRGTASSEPAILRSAAVLLLTGATGRVGSALLPRLTGRGEAVRCLVRDPRRLGPARVRVQIALGDLADPASFRHALRGVRTVVHLAGAWRDQPRAGLEELNGLATWRLLRAAERAGVHRFVFLSPLGAAPEHALRVQRAKALAERAVEDAAMATVTFRASAIYAPGESRVGVLAGGGDARIQPICAIDVAACVLAALDLAPSGHRTLELAGPDELTWRRFVALAAGRRRVPALPPALLRPALRAYEALTGPAALLTWDEAARATAAMTTPRGTADAVALGVAPSPPVPGLGG